jgi:hypothetical protein
LVVSPKLGLELGYALGKIGDHRIAFLDHRMRAVFSMTRAN